MEFHYQVAGIIGIFVAANFLHILYKVSTQCISTPRKKLTENVRIVTNVRIGANGGIVQIF